MSYINDTIINGLAFGLPLFIMAIIYLIMTVVLSGLVRLLERGLSAGDRK